MGVAASRDFPYEFGETIESYEGKTLWKLSRGVKKADRAPVSILTFDAKKNPTKGAVASNFLKRSRTIRYPYLLPFIDGYEIEGTGVTIVTEEVTPLVDVLQELKGYPDSLSWGLYQIAKALSFLNNECNMIHGNVTIDNIFVNKAGDWKLGGLELLSALSDQQGLIRNHNDIVSAKLKAPEYASNTWTTIQAGPSFAIDSWMLATLIYEIYNGKVNQMEDLKKVGNIPKNLLRDYQQMLTSNAANRLDLAEFVAESDFFDNNYVQTCLFLENIALKEAQEKDKFFKQLDTLIDVFPQSTSKYKILPHLVTAVDYGGAGANSRVLGPLLKIAKQLSAEEYAAKVTPSLVRWFSNPDRNFRHNLLQNMDLFVDYLTATQIDEQVFPALSTGFNDPAPALRELTVKSTVYLIPKMSPKVVNTQLLKCLAKMQLDDEPGIRTNTTICLAKIASYLQDETRQKILVPAFTRAIRDTFPRARVAGLVAFQATVNYYNKEDIATKVLPAVCSLLIDIEKEVRDAAFQTMNVFLTKLKKISDTGIETSTGSEEAKTDSGVLSWAISSLSKKIYGGETGQAPGPPGSSSTPQSPQPELHATPKATQASQPTKQTSSSSLSNSNAQSKAPAQQDDGWDDFEDLDEPQPPKPSKPKAKNDGWDNEDVPVKVQPTKPKESGLKLSHHQPATNIFPTKQKSQDNLNSPKASPRPETSKSGWDDDEVEVEEEQSGWNEDAWEDDDEDDWAFSSSAKASKLDQKKPAKGKKA